MLYYAVRMSANFDEKKTLQFQTKHITVNHHLCRINLFCFSFKSLHFIWYHKHFYHFKADGFLIEVIISHRFT